MRSNNRLTTHALAWLTGLCVLSLAGSATAQETWAVLNFEVRGVGETDAATFRDLLQAELAKRVKGGLVAPQNTCPDTVCATEVGRQVGADKVVYGALSTLGAKIVVTVNVVSSGSGQLYAADRMTVDRVEDLEAVAGRIAMAVTEGKRVEDTAKLGNITAEEAKPDRRRQGDPGFLFRIGGLVPFSDTHGAVDFGLLLDASFFYEARNWAIELRVGTHFDTSDDEQRGFFKMPIDIGAFYIFDTGDVAPLLGGGMGVRYHFDRRPTVVSQGSVISTRHTEILRDHAWGFGMYARAGVMFLRTYSVRLMLNIDYDVTFSEVNGESFPNTLSFGLGVIF